MTCSEAERLFDAYLDGYLSGTLRLELDAHRLRCRRCQQTLAMLESCGHVIASDRREPAASMDFTERVMSKIGARGAARQGTIRFRSMRVAIAIGLVVQAAAVLMIAIMLPSDTAEDRAREDLKSYIFAGLDSGVRAGFREVVDSSRQLGNQLPMLAAFASIPERMEHVAEWRPGFNVFEFLNAHSSTDAGEPGETRESNPGSYSF